MNISKYYYSTNKRINNLESINIIICLVVTLLVIGAVMVFDTSSIKAIERLNPVNIVFLKHTLWMVLAITGMLIMMKLDYHYLQKYSTLILIVALAGLVIVLIPGLGTVTNGARRWIRFGSYFGFQPSEFAKLAMIIFMSSYIAARPEKMSTFTKGFLFPIILTGIVSLLILKEPDLGTAMFITLVSFILMIVGGTRIIYIIFTMLASIPHVYTIIYNQAYQKSRLLTFLDPWKDSDGAGYQIVQSWIALGSGGLTGLGLGESRQKLFFLPESNSDFIFSIIGEEFGFIGSAGIIVLFVLLAWQGMKVCKSAPDIFGFFLSLGITISIILQSALNIAVVTGSVPTTGFPLPFISTGGSSLILTMIGIGILLNVAKQSKTGLASVDGVENKRRLVT